MGHGGKGNVIHIDMHANFLVRFPYRRHADGFASVQMPGRDAVVAVFEAGVKAAQQQDLVFAEE
jgi:hypothetical protein